MAESRRYVVVPDKHSPGQFEIDAIREGNPAGPSVALISATSGAGVAEFTDSEYRRLYAAAHKAAQVLADEMNRTEPPSRVQPETVSFESHRKIAKDPLPKPPKPVKRKPKEPGST